MSDHKVADVIIEVLQQAGVKRCYGIVGDTLNYVTESMSKSDIEWIHVRHEEVGGFAAGADALLTGQLTACAGSCGPGSLHFINGLFESHRNRAPVILIASQLSTESAGFTDFPQYVDFKSVYASTSVFCEEITQASQARHIMTLACQTALNKRGVAVVIVPVNISQAIAASGLPFVPHRASPDILPNKTELQAIVKLISQHQNIAIYAGAGCEDAHDEVVKFAEVLKAPITHTSRAKDFIEYDNPYNMGMTGIFGSKAGYHTVMDCDLLILLGTDFAWAQYYPNHAKVLQIDLDPTHLGRRHPIDLGVVGKISSTLRALIPLLDVRKTQDFLDYGLTLKQASEETRRKEERIGKNGLIHPQYLVSLINKYADQDAVFFADGGSPMVWLLRHIDVNGKRRTFTSLLHGTMANAMPQALGAQKAYPKRQIIALCGDGGIAMLLGDLLTTIQEKLPIKIVVINNSSLNFVELEQKVEGLLDHYTDLINPDFGQLAQVIGLYGQTVTQGEGLEHIVEAFLKHDGPALLDVHTNPVELVMPPDPHLSQVSSTSLYAAKALLSGRAGDVKDLLVNNFIK
ncbi:thiamine pyrophosphate-dependent enzyme [Acinetobacter rathckeae]|uniref:thiamine pyrophosphate-dependent enzyme n=1 Tax=Acinetobacter rathckeae TaxID=2605272 RepID=UPI0018A2E792|nr:thiamine pyrophosphate-dependent enzyme [Acinetobacter rathckeae]MBF7688169.1 ubiquinone-dependent pyruvate dehydrogenase [Acinetobacter rathckeae]MBF7695320.1 ubiquinone-dependent pyruvate dehydrogenase [Acinetobacter rathckeae]